MHDLTLEQYDQVMAAFREARAQFEADPRTHKVQIHVTGAVFDRVAQLALDLGVSRSEAGLIALLPGLTLAELELDAAIKRAAGEAEDEVPF